MKRLLFMLVMLCQSFAVFAQQSLAAYPADKITSRTYVIHGPKDEPNPENRGFMNNPAFIIADKGVIVVDPGSSVETGEMVLAKIKAVTTKPVTHVFNTHIHGDHWLGNDAIEQAYPKVTIIADPRMLKKAKDGDAQAWYDLLVRLTDGATRGTNIVYPNKTVSNGHELKIHNLTFRIHSVGIAHSDSDIMIELVEDSIMFTGDNVAYQRILRMDDGNFKDNIAACEKAISLNLKHYVPGHGPTGSVDIIKRQKQYFETLYRIVGQYYEEGLSDFEIKPFVVKALVDYKDWAGFDTQVGKHVSHALLQIEQAEFN